MLLGSYLNKVAQNSYSPIYIFYLNMLYCAIEQLSITLLFNRIGELIFPSPFIAFLDASIFPQVPNGLDIRTFESFYCFRVNIQNEFRFLLLKQDEKIVRAVIARLLID